MNAINLIFDEHKLLMKAIETTKYFQTIEDNEQYHKSMNDIILFFRNFSESYHHPKEENILYPMLLKHASNIDPVFIHEICDNHEDFKSLMAQIENAFIIYDYSLMRRLIGEYIIYLEEHIKKENKMILKLVPEILSKEELETVGNEFEKLDNLLGEKARLTEIFFKINLQFV